jgi:hypothetical protein
MGQGSGRARANRAASAAGGRFIGNRTAAGIGRLRNRAGGLTDLANRARANRRRRRPAARVR